LKKSQLAKNSKGSAGYIVAHAKWRASRGKERPSEPWGPYRDPTVALKRAEEIVSRLDELGLAREVRCPFCNMEINELTDYDRQYHCACGAQYWAESLEDTAESCREWATESRISLGEGEFRVVRKFDFLADNQFSLPEAHDEWVAVFARVKKIGVTIRMKSGPYAGKIRYVTSEQIDPMRLLASSVRHGWRWEVDYLGATFEETFAWLRADIICRAVLARQEGRPVHFDGREYTDLQEWEDAISSSGQNVSIDCDDKTGFWVKSVGPEPTKH